MSMWLVRAGKNGENEQTALVEGLVTIGWNELPDLSGCDERQQIAELFKKAHPEASSARAANEVGQVWAFRGRIEVGDLVVLPLKQQSAIAIGKITGGYKYRNDLGDSVRHVRSVSWIRTDLPRTSFEQDVLFSFGAFMTVCRIQRNNAEARVRAILEGKVAPIKIAKEAEEGDDEAVDQIQDIELAARDQINQFIQQKFSGHQLATLVEAVLQAEGYFTRSSPPGPDGGVDILAGSPPMGFGSPRLCVQVKSSPTPAGVEVLRGLQGILQNFHAENGLLVCWGGFKATVVQEARQSFFTIRLWDSGDLLEAILRNHDRLPENLKAELPLKRVWALVPDEIADL